MKVFTFIFSLYILVLVAIPCIDKPANTTLQKLEAPQSSHNSQDQESDHCSPFCTCSCCATFSIQEDNYVLFNSFSYLLAQFSEHPTSSASFHFSSIWQPPKIG